MGWSRCISWENSFIFGFGCEGKKRKRKSFLEHWKHLCVWRIYRHLHAYIWMCLKMWLQPLRMQWDVGQSTALWLNSPFTLKLCPSCIFLSGILPSADPNTGVNSSTLQPTSRSFTGNACVAFILRKPVSKSVEDDKQQLIFSPFLILAGVQRLWTCSE